MELYNKLNKNEVKMIDAYVDRYAAPNHVELNKLLQPWEEAKGEYLYKLLGNQFMISKDMEWDKPKSKLNDEFYRLFHNSQSAAARFQRIFDRFLWDNRQSLGQAYFMLQSLLNMDYLMATAYTGDEFEVNTPEGKTIKVQKGARPMRIISRVAKAYGGIDLLTEFQNEVSVILTSKKLTGRLTLSIHPFDYMTMSDNNSDWTSCMSWREGGCYCRGTVEMMNSKMVLVAYLASDDPMSVDGGTWNSKKWRELFIVTPEIIAGVKGYPYQNEILVQEINKWIKELAEKNLGWQYDNQMVEYNHRNDFDYVDEATGEVHNAYIRFSTNTMYNDFGSLDSNYAIFGKGLEDYNLHINYSGPEECMCCGSTDACFDGEGCLTCEDCNDDERYYCSCCEDRIYGDDVYWLDDEPYCYSCYRENCVEDPITHDEHHEANMTRVYFIDDDTNVTRDTFNDAPSTYFYNPFDHRYAWCRHFTESVRLFTLGWDSWYYVTPAMFRDTGDIPRYFDVPVNN